MLGGSGPGGKKVGILAALASASDGSEITCEGADAVMRTTRGDRLHLQCLSRYLDVVAVQIVSAPPLYPADGGRLPANHIYSPA